MPCKYGTQHANAVKAQAQEYVEKKQAKKVMTRSVTGSLAVAHALIRIADVKYFSTAKPGTFFARNKEDEEEKHEEEEADEEKQKEE
ncbi:hypothetical protein NQ318_005778 [Aromia moschata]|uniref:Uncharacterized protein n=1 Tax=Aromia moschata TaxID=1265417 RepID=A0AAV8YU73_9CUCU|nr:hypothetical protein NQ318_005778 [Aromia moschata]